MKTAGEQIRYFRELKGKTQEDLADSLSISVNAYSKIERNITDVNLSRLIQIASCFDITLLELLSAGKKTKSQSEEIDNLKKIIAEKDKEILLLQKRVITLLDKKQTRKNIKIHKPQLGSKKTKKRKK